MNATELFHQISFHDSLVTGLVLDRDTGTLRLKIELGNYNQRTYDPARDPETIPGELVFIDVNNFEHEPDSSATISGDQVDGEIINVEAIPIENGLSDVKLVVVVTDYRSQANETHVFRFKTNGATWHPDST
jgi:hypothetical protein